MFPLRSLKPWGRCGELYTYILYQPPPDFIARELLESGKSRDEVALGEKGASDDARQELFDFVEWHVDRLATLEETSFGGEKSSLRTFCRIDVGLMHSKKTQLHWFVNEVERGPNTTVFGRAGKELFIPLARKFLTAFWKWYTYRQSTIY